MLVISNYWHLRCVTDSPQLDSGFPSAQPLLSTDHSHLEIKTLADGFF
jgi:hypothetical protein